MTKISDFAVFYLVCRWHGLERQTECPHFDAHQSGCRHSPGRHDNGVSLCYSGDANREARSKMGATGMASSIGDDDDLFPRTVSPNLEIKHLQ